MAKSNCLIDFHPDAIHEIREAIDCQMVPFIDRFLRDSEGGRNPFTEIRFFDPKDWTVQEYRYDRSAGWVSIGAPADAVGVSHLTVRRHL